MSQAIQQHPEMKMVRHAHFLDVAHSLLPSLHRYVQRPQALINVVEDQHEIHGWRADISGSLAEFYGQTLTTGDRVILDFGTHCVGYLNVACHAVGSPPDAPAHVDFTFGETLSEIAEPFSDYQGWVCSSWLQHHEHYFDVLPENLTLPRRYCFRYLKIEVKAVSRKFKLQFSDISLNTVSSAPEHCPPCQSRDPLLRKIDDVAVLTLRNCMQDVFEDGPKRDRRLWLGDLRLQALVNDVTFAHHDLVRRCLYLFAGHTRDDGMISANIFVKPDVVADDTFLFDYALFFVDTLYNYIERTQDHTTLNELWPLALRQIDLALERCDENGIVRDSNDWWSFIDWHESLNKQASSQGVLIYCLHRAIELAARCDTAQTARLARAHETLKVAALRHLWDDQQGFYVSGENAQISAASQIWLVLAQVGDEAHQRRVMDNLLRCPPAIGMITPYLRHHFIVALLQTGQRQQAVDEIKAYWGAMVEYGADTFWELFDPARPNYSPYGSKLINSYCHAWSCTPAWFIRQFGL